MFGLYPAAPTRPDDYVIHRAGRSLRNARVRPRGLTPRRLAQIAGGERRRGSLRWVTPRPWIDEPAILVSDVIAGPESCVGTLLDPTVLQPVPVGTLIRTTSHEPARHWLVWPDGGLRQPAGLNGDDPQSVAAYIDEPAMAHFGRELDTARLAAAVAGENAGDDDDLGDTVIAWIADLLRGDRAATRRPRTRVQRKAPTPARSLVCRWR